MNAFKPFILRTVALLLLLSLVACGSVVAQEADTVSEVSVAEQTAVRWQAMGDFYADNDLLNETVDAERVAEQTAVRWQAMADFYAENDLLNASR